MKLKKCSALLSLLSFAALFLHLGYSAYAYLTFCYNPVLTKAFSIPLIVLTCLHAVLGMCAVFLLSDGVSALYPRKNLKTVVQRITAALIFPLLILHLQTFDLMKTASAGGQYALVFLLIFAQILFYAAAISHAAVSFSRALITLGLLPSAKALKIVDTVVYALCALAFTAAAFAVIKGQVAMFLPH